MELQLVFSPAEIDYLMQAASEITPALARQEGRYQKLGNETPGPLPEAFIGGTAVWVEFLPGALVLEAYSGGTIYRDLGFELVWLVAFEPATLSYKRYRQAGEAVCRPGRDPDKPVTVVVQALSLAHLEGLKLKSAPITADLLAQRGRFVNRAADRGGPHAHPGDGLLGGEIWHTDSFISAKMLATQFGGAIYHDELEGYPVVCVPPPR